MDGSDEVGGVTGGEGVEVEGVDGDEIEVHGGREGEGGGWDDEWRCRGRAWIWVEGEGCDGVI
ncbi:uncharacterized protein PADG_11962 [Paracoccidioides brasiliensis Pb18]|uniref:Uncharacterized protein n=1 Tax=Paracoccidioides brasiliensis (strain Pb18) TaxID=502780 RepID=A0A0A0HTJ3_PARBD|nr:uncharacterized protein PADG_11962 [Paracoccidioides brasiliensis Pb18]KGM91982.1 hypothetical protein PADG_11962 [Paracoccidioides brasiliensis Pb18]